MVSSLDSKVGSPTRSPEWAPMRQFICKVASRCNLDCDYCYIYHHVDQTWRDQPQRMSLDTAAQLGRRIKEHALRHHLSGVDVTLHGGEPLLVGVDYLTQWVEQVAMLAEGVPLQFQMQTNGVLFDEEALQFCLKWNVRVGLSMDGPRKANDLHRFNFDRKSSFEMVERAARLLASPEGKRIWSGFLAVIDLQHDPVEVYDYFRSFNPHSIEFLLPLANYDARPPGKLVDLNTTPYADWLLAIFLQWFNERPQTITVRRFRDIIALMAGATSSSEEWGLQPVDFAVVETNGSIEAVDTLKTCYSGANYLGLNIFTNTFDDMYTAPAVVERQARWSKLCATCQECELVGVCGGGYFPHRYSAQNGFQNPSIYCADLMKMIREIHRAVSATLVAAQAAAVGSSEPEQHRVASHPSA